MKGRGHELYTDFPGEIKVIHCPSEKLNSSLFDIGVRSTVFHEFANWVYLSC